MPECPRIFGCAMLAAYTVAPRHSTPRCLTYLIWRYTVALRHPQLQEAIAGANKFASHRLPRIFVCALLAAYTVAPRQSTPRCLTVFYLEIYGCLAAPADAASLCRCKQVCTARVSSYIRLRNACRIYCSASAEQPRCLTYLIWRYKCALQHTHLREAIAAANKFASLRLLTSVTSFFISPNGAANIFALLSASAYICRIIVL